MTSLPADRTKTSMISNARVPIGTWQPSARNSRRWRSTCQRPEVYKQFILDALGSLRIWFFLGGSSIAPFTKAIYRRSIAGAGQFNALVRDNRRGDCPLFGSVTPETASSYAQRDLRLK